MKTLFQLIENKLLKILTDQDFLIPNTLQMVTISCPFSLDSLDTTDLEKKTGIKFISQTHKPSNLKNVKMKFRFSSTSLNLYSQFTLSLMNQFGKGKLKFHSPSPHPTIYYFSLPVFVYPYICLSSEELESPLPFDFWIGDGIS